MIRDITTDKLFSLTKEELQDLTNPMTYHKRLWKRADWVNEAEKAAKKKGLTIIPKNIIIQECANMNNNQEYNKARNFIQGILYKAAESGDNTAFNKVVTVMKKHVDHNGRTLIKEVYEELTSETRVKKQIEGYKYAFADAMIAGDTKKAENLKKLISDLEANMKGV